MKAFLDYMKGLPAIDDFVNEIDGFIKEIKVKEEERVSYMTYEMKMREAHDDGVEEGEEKKGREIVRNMIQIGFDNETIRKVTSYSIEDIQNERNNIR